MKAPTLPELRHLLDELHYEAHKSGDPTHPEVVTIVQAEQTIRWLLDEYLRRGTHVVSS